MDVGEEWIYRERDYASSERVRIVAIHKRKQGFRADIEFLDGEKAGMRENVAGGRLRRPWSEVEMYDRDMAHWQQFD